MTERPSVLLCSDYLLPSDGGVETVVETLARQLTERDVDVGVFALDTADGQPNLTSTADVDVYLCPSIDLTQVLGLQAQFAPAAIARFREVMSEHDPDIVHVHNRFFFTSLVAASVAGSSAVPLVMTFHLGPLDELSGASGVISTVYDQIISRALLRRIDAIIAVSEAVAAHASQLSGESTNTHVAPNAVDVQAFRPSPEPPTGNTVLFVGRLNKNKGPQLLVESLPAVLQCNPDTKLRIVGTGPLRDTLESRVESLGIHDCVEFCGYVESVAEEMGDADVFCRPSLSEGLPLTLLEAMACGLPAVVTPVAGVGDIVRDGETGILIEEPEPDAIADALNTVLAEPETAIRVGEAARKYVVDMHSWEDRTRNVIRVYEETSQTEGYQQVPWK